MLRFGMHCHLLVPDLFWPEREFTDAYRELGLPALERLLSRGRRTRADAAPGEENSAEAWLCRHFGVERQGQVDWPVAPYSLLADGGEPGAHYWLRADPVHLKLEGNRVVLADSGVFPVSQREADGLVGELNAHFAAEGMVFSAPRRDRWYLRLASAPALETTPLPEAVGKSIEALLPRGGDGQTWRARLNLIQMLLHNHEVNEKREAAGTLRINSIWLWGGGLLQGGLSAPFKSLWSTDAFATGLAQAARVAAQPLPEDAAGLLRAAASEGVMLVVLDGLRRAAQYGDAHAWRAGLEQLERDWFAPLLQALTGERIGMLSLHALGPGGALSAEVTHGDLRRFWRRVQPLAHWARA
jgi:hypothetical protein